MYSYLSSGVFRYMFLMSAPAKRAPAVPMTLFHRILDDSMSADLVVSSCGYLIGKIGRIPHRGDVDINLPHFQFKLSVATLYIFPD